MGCPNGLIPDCDVFGFLADSDVCDIHNGHVFHDVWYAFDIIDA
jgi:hypothetical protein